MAGRPLGAYRGVDALDVWEHILYQEFIERRWRPQLDRLQDQWEAAFEYYEDNADVYSESTEWTDTEEMEQRLLDMFEEDEEEDFDD